MIPRSALHAKSIAQTGAAVRHRPRVRFALAWALLALAVTSATLWMGLQHATRPRIAVAVNTFPADGRQHRIAILSRPLHLPLDASDIVLAANSTDRLKSTNLDASHVAVDFRAPVNPARTTLTLSAMGTAFHIPVEAEASSTDTVGDGTPGWMRLHAAEDRHAFRVWFTTLAVLQADQSEKNLPPEITDCASLLRFCYRQALLQHDDRWYKQFPAGPFSVGHVPALPSVQQWSYPNTPLKEALFRVRPGPFVASDPATGAFAQFADAKTLLSRNAFLLGRDLRAALPGDLLFFHQLEQDSQYHSMIVTGEQKAWVVYHTGPIDGHKGEMRRVLLRDLLRHPDARWRPIPSNPNFLGVYRWNLLRED